MSPHKTSTNSQAMMFGGDVLSMLRTEGYLGTSLTCDRDEGRY